MPKFVRAAQLLETCWFPALLTLSANLGLPACIDNPQMQQGSATGTVGASGSGTTAPAGGSGAAGSSVTGGAAAAAISGSAGRAPAAGTSATASAVAGSAGASAAGGASAVAAAGTGSVGSGTAGVGVAGTRSAPTAGAGAAGSSAAVGGGGGAASGNCGAESFAAIYRDILAKPAYACSSAGCHGRTSAIAEVGNLDLSTSAAAYSSLSGKTSDSMACSGKVRVKAGDPANSLFVQKLREETTKCGEVMPLGADLISDPDLARVTAWIQGGACNN